MPGLQRETLRKPTERYGSSIVLSYVYDGKAEGLADGIFKVRAHRPVPVPRDVRECISSCTDLGVGGQHAQLRQDRGCSESPEGHVRLGPERGSGGGAPSVGSTRGGRLGRVAQARPSF